jgi:uncharacterized protein
VTKHERNARYWIDKLQLTPHPEGGYYRQTYRSDLTLPREALPGFTGSRPASTAIYFLLEGENFSAFHRIRSDEIWHFYAAFPLLVHSINPEGGYSKFLLGSNPDKQETLQAAVPAGTWFASHVADWKSWALVGCTVAPGFDFADFELADRENLRKSYPQHREIIDRLTRPFL